MAAPALDTFRSNVRLLLVDRSLTITELAARSGITRVGLSRILNGHDGVNLETADNIAKALRIPLRELLSEELKNLVACA